MQICNKKILKLAATPDLDLTQLISAQKRTVSVSFIQRPGFKEEVDSSTL